MICRDWFRFAARANIAVLLLLFGPALTSAAQTARPREGPPASGRPNRFDQGPKPGTAAPDFELKTAAGGPIRASILWSNKPTVIMTGSHTCPVFRGKAEAFEKLVHEFSNEVNFVVLYTVEAHPKGDPSPYTGREWVTTANEELGLLIRQPKTIEERAERARTCLQAMKLTVPVAVDQMDNAVWKAYGSAPNAACLVGKDGQVIEDQGWFDPAKMRQAIKGVSGAQNR